MPELDPIAFLAMIAAPATNSGLIVLLPLVGAVVGGIVGAIIGAWANSWYRDREAKKAEVRERKGLLLLIDLEVGYNKEQLQNCIETTSGKARLFDLLSINRLSTDIWDESAARLTQLLDDPVEVRALAVYYKQIAKILEAIESKATPRHESIVSKLSKTGSDAIELGDAAIELIHLRYFKEGKPPLIPYPPSISARDLRKAAE